MAHGGAREGAGRKVANHTIEAEKFRAILIAKVVEKAEPLVEALIKKGLSGDVPALREIQDRVLGKPKEVLDVTTDGEPLQQSVIVAIDRIYGKSGSK